MITNQSKSSVVYLIIFFKNHTDLAIKKATPAGGFFDVQVSVIFKEDNQIDNRGL